MELRSKLADPHSLQNFFDGGRPTPELVFARDGIPERSVVDPAVSDLKSIADRYQHKPYCLLLSGSGGDGKLTALLQIFGRLLETEGNWQVWWRSEVHSTTTVIDLVKSLPGPRDGQHWLIAIDDVDRMALNLLVALKSLNSNNRTDVHFLIAARDVDWNACTRSTKGEWHEAAEMQFRSLAGLQPAECQRIAQAWVRADQTGFGPNKIKTMIKTTADSLLAAAREEGTMGDGALFGAMLRVRKGKPGLATHVRDLTGSLLQKEWSKGSLFDAYADIAVIHDLTPDLLSRPVLAVRYGCSEQELETKVIGPLLNESMVREHNTFITTRHRAIAEAVQAMLEQDGTNPFARVLALLDAALECRNTHKREVPNLPRWCLDLTRIHLDRNQLSQALDIAKRVYDAGIPGDDIKMALAKTQRRCGFLDGATETLKHVTGEAAVLRSFCREWGALQRDRGDLAAAALGFSFALADHVGIRPMTGPNCLQASPALQDLLAAYRALGMEAEWRAIEPLSRYMEMECAKASPSTWQTPGSKPGSCPTFLREATLALGKATLTIVGLANCQAPLPGVLESATSLTFEKVCCLASGSTCCV